MRQSRDALRVLMFLLGFILIGSAIYAHAAEKSFTGAWTWSGDESDIQGFRIKDQDNNVVIDTAAIPPSARQATGIVQVAEGGCVTLFVVAVEVGGEESGNSNILNYCLPKPKTITVNQFSFTIE